ncbi:biotin carboxylase [Saccharomonospora amisosensis]|uniref:Biotin carboxylase n=1 Tax=Saccharomonospora amisosensis TaxID=1128677 RepID=A0A7X5ZSU7_9PSEU|nr:ATP-grasp domain-containing protein [Saccharomonospora amisosensis]NIJ14277.1 biotin carboxylase [Saccharomonospora amisosensis]
MNGAETVVVGYTEFLLDLLSGLVADRSVVVIEEPEVIERRQLDRAHMKHACLREVLPAPYQSEDWPSHGGAAVERPSGVRAVLPGSEYAVRATAELADLWGLAGAGARAGHTLRNKDVLRARMDGHVRQPRWNCPSSEQQLLDFAEQFGGAVVLKPSNGQASAGVFRCSNMSDVVRYRGEFDDFSGDPLRASSITPPRLLVEQRLTGPEFSVESFVIEGEVVFCNVTAKTVAAGEHPVELGHAAPAGLDGPPRRRLLSAVSRMARLAGVRTAVLHSEWIITDGLPHLIECAGRLPGDNITALISHAWGFDFVRAWLSIMRGERPQLPEASTAAAAIWFLCAEPGAVTSVDGVADAAAASDVLEVRVTVGPGDATSGLKNSWSRIGYVLARGPSAGHALVSAQSAAGIVKVAVA